VSLIRIGLLFDSRIRQSSSFLFGDCPSNQKKSFTAIETKQKTNPTSKPPPPPMSLDSLTTSISAVVGTSLLLFFATSPKSTNNREEDDDDERQLKGFMKYSSYHRKKMSRNVSTIQ
jgi:hypothetical protein